jgi:hypothetical protein
VEIDLFHLQENDFKKIRHFVGEPNKQQKHYKRNPAIFKIVRKESWVRAVSLERDASSACGGATGCEKL